MPDHCVCGGVGYHIIECTPGDRKKNEPKCLWDGTPHSCICTIKANTGRSREFVREDCGLNLMQQARLTLANFDPGRSPFAAEIHDAMTGMLSGNEQRPWLTIIGRSGTGKTHAAAAIVFSLVMRGVGARFTTADDLLEDIREGAFIDGENIDKRLQHYYHKPVLAIDDLRLDMLTSEAQANWIERILLKRYDSGAVTILTSNNAVKDFPQRIQSRIEDARIGRLVITAGPDERSRIVPDHIDPATGEIIERPRQVAS